MADVDVIIIGSGPGGGASAWALASQGVRVLLLEAGPAYKPQQDYRLSRYQWEQSGFPHKISPWGRQSYALLQKLDEKWRELRSWSGVSGPMNTTDRRQPWGYHHVQGLGGSTLHFSGEAHRLHPESMQMKSRFGVAADWPLDYAELEPYYQQAERVVGVAGPLKQGARWRSENFPLPAHGLGYASQKLQTGCEKLGLQWQANSLAILSAPYDDRPPCNYCSNCSRGCPRRDKGSVDVTFIAQALRTGNLTVRTGCRVIALEAGADDRVHGVRCREADGSERHETAPVIIVACGAVETPRLLLRSESAHAPQGLANESGQVGQNFMETLFWTSSGLHPEPLASYRGLPADGISWDFNAPDAIPGVVGGCRFSHATADADLLGPIHYAQRVVAGWGREHKAAMREHFGRVIAVGAIGESLPNPGSYIDLDPQAKDELGLPKARIHSHLDEGELKRLSFMAKTTRRILKSSGVEDLVEEYGSYDSFSATHVFGTCRMGNDASDSVVDRYGQSHRWKNLFVVDASTFPSSGGGESPSLTIEALAIRSVGHIAGRLKRREF